MEGFKANPKMKCDLPCFKEGGFVTKKAMKKEEKAEEKKDLAVDKKIAKKAISQHESAKHKGDPKTELKLKKGGRSKKEEGTVKRFDSKAINMKKDKSDKKAIAKTKKMKPVVETTTMVEEIAPAPMEMSVEEMPMLAGGRRPFFNEEPDDATAPVKRRPMKRPMPGKGAVSNAERQGIMEMFQGGPDGMSGLGGAGAAGVASMRAPSAAMGNAGAAGMGAMSDLERQNLMKGLEAVGQYAYGGKVC
jgi:hypothetical protein